MAFPNYLFDHPVVWDTNPTGIEIRCDDPIKLGQLSDYVLLTITSKQGKLTLTFGELEQLYERARKLLKRD